MSFYSFKKTFVPVWWIVLVNYRINWKWYLICVIVQHLNSMYIIKMWSRLSLCKLQTILYWCTILSISAMFTSKIVELLSLEKRRHRPESPLCAKVDGCSFSQRVAHDAGEIYHHSRTLDCQQTQQTCNRCPDLCTFTFTSQSKFKAFII